MIKSIGQYIKDLRKSKDLTQSELAKLLKHNDATRVSRIESNKESLPLKNYKTLIHSLNADTDLLETMYLEIKRKKFKEAIK